MVFHIPILVALFVLLSGNDVSAGPRQSCLSCHNSHYAERGRCTDCHLGNPLSERKNIAHYRLINGKYAQFTLGETPVVRDGKRLMEQLACRRCHRSDGYGNQLASSLDTVINTRQPAAIAESIRQPVAGMPDFRLGEARITALVNAVLGGGQGKPGGEQPLVRHFEKGAHADQDLFTKSCGACHRMLTARKGLLGKGEVGPNLSGLLTRFYPATFADDQKWTFERLKNWLNNPRRIRTEAVMKPVLLKNRQLRELNDMLDSDPAAVR